MASTKITLKEAEEMLIEFDKAYRNFYQNSDELLLLIDERTKAKEHDFYEQISEDSKEFIKSKGFSNSWIWGLFFEEKQKNRKFFNPYLRAFEELIVFYQDHIFIEDDEDGNGIYKKTSSSQPEKLKATLFQKAKTLIKHKSFKMVIGFVLIPLVSIMAVTHFTKKTQPFEEIEIGEQIWSSEISVPIKGSFCYNDVKENCIGFGRLYSYDAAKKVAGRFDGWEIPLMSDYEKLISHYGSDTVALKSLFKGGDSGFEAIMSGYKDGTRSEYVTLGKEAAFWTSSIGDTYDEIGQERPYALRLTRFGAEGDMCDCWTRRDALSLRLIKTNRGYIFNKVNDSIITEKTTPIPEYQPSNYLCTFDNIDSSDYKILIVPFRSVIKDNNVEKDIGAIIEERLERINKRDSLNLNIFYCKNFEYNKSSHDGDEADYFRRVMNESGADHIIYGATQDIAINKNADLTKIRLSYCTNLKESIAGELGCDNQYDYKLTSLSNIFQGELLENIEHLIYWNTALSTFKRGEKKKTIDYLDIIFNRLKVKTPKLLEFRATNYIELANYDDALKDVNSIIRNHKDPKTLSSAYNLRAIIKLIIRDKSGLDDLNNTLNYNEKSSATYHHIAAFKWKLEQNAEQSLKAYDTAIELAENDEIKAFELNSKGMVLYSLGRYEEALRLCERAIELYPNGYCQWLNKGTNLYALGRSSEAIGAIEKSLSINPNYYQAYNWRARIYEEMGYETAAFNDYKYSMKLEANNEAYVFLFQNAMIKEHYHDALELVENALKKNPKSAKLLYFKKQVYMRIKCDYEANEISKMLERMSPTMILYQRQSSGAFIDIEPLYDSLKIKKSKLIQISIPDGLEYSDFIDHIEKDNSKIKKEMINDAIRNNSF